MGELWIVLAVSCGLAYLSENKYYFPRDGRRKSLSFFFIFLLIVYLSLFAGLRTRYNDTATYIAGYNASSAFPDVLDGFDWQLGANPGFQLLNSLMKAAGFHSQTFVLFYSTLFVTSAVLFLKRYSSSFTMSIFLFVCVNGYLFSLAAMKQCAAISIGLLAIPFAEKRKWILFALGILLASTFHPYILMFLLLPVLQFRPWSFGTWILLLLTAVAARFLPRFVETAVDVAALLGDGYDAKAFVGEGVNIFRVLVAGVPVLLTLVFLPNLPKKVTRHMEYTFINCSFIFTAIMVIGLFGTANYFGRTANYFIVFPAIALPAILGKLSPNDRRLLAFAMVVCYLAYFYYGYGINSSFSKGFARISLWEYLTQISQ